MAAVLIQQCALNGCCSDGAVRTEWLPVLMLKLMQTAQNNYMNTLQHESQTNIAQKFSSSFPGHTIVSIPKTNP